MIPQAAYILFAAAFTLGACAACGRLLLGRLPLNLSRPEFHILSFLAGAPILSLIVFALASLGLVYKGTLLAVGLALLVAAARWTRHTAHAQSIPPLPRGAAWLLACALPFGVWYFAAALGPEASPDRMSYHLGITARTYRAHGFEPLTGNLLASLPRGVEMLYLFAWPFGRHSAAAVIHLSFLCALAALVVCHGRRFGHPWAGSAAALALFATPVVGVDATSAYVDLAAAAIIFGVYHTVRVWELARSLHLAALAGLLAGYCYAIKYTATAALVWALVVIGYRQWRVSAPLLRPLAVFLGAASVSILPWVVRNAVVVGNPFAPLFNRWFPNPHVTIAFEREGSAFLRHYDLPSFWSLPLELTLRGDHLGGVLGPLFLLAPLALFSLRHFAARQLGLFVLALLAVYPANIATRFLIPALAPVLLIAAIGLERRRALLVALTGLHAVLSWPAAVDLWARPGVWKVERIPWRQALHVDAEEPYLNERSGAYLNARMIESLTRPDARVLTFQPAAEAYTSRDIVVAFHSAHGIKLRDILLAGVREEEQPRYRVEFNGPRSAAGLRIVQTAEGPDQWSINEISLFQSGRRLPAASWRATTQPYPWDAGLLIDGRLLPRWRSWERQRPGMFAELDLGQRTTFDRLVIDGTRDQWNIRLTLHLWNAATSSWEHSGAEPAVSQIAVPPGLRRLAMQEVRAAGITHILISRDDYLDADMRREASQWGIRWLGERNASTLYEIE
ncbi:MAG: discoidin domain-containing protein [Acidobacteria bacterium]|nr:discoidin domain-containing protein [Acidobacteriota bacterium]